MDPLCSSDNVPLFFRCPISMDLMDDPVTISTGVTYDRKNIERWFFLYNKKTCPATMQRLDDFHLTPNHTLSRLISSLQIQPSSPPTDANADELLCLLQKIRSSPLKLKVNFLQKLGSMVVVEEDMAMQVVELGGIQILGDVIKQEDVGVMEFRRASEEAVGILHRLLPLLTKSSAQLLTTQDCMSSMINLLQRGTPDAGLHTLLVFQKIARTCKDWCQIIADQNIEFYESLLHLMKSAESSRARSTAMDLLTMILIISKRRRLRAVEAGAAKILIELLPDANLQKCERMLLLVKLLCECPQGRWAVLENEMGLTAVSKTLLNVSNTATKLGVKILWLISSFVPTNKVLHEMMVCGATKKLHTLSEMDGSSSTSSVRDLADKMINLHADFWQHYHMYS
ncbi:U-box domain-containing protein [Zostera marina]|uniref:U-box domain-containing protein n=1 Tax=Zostera marina TaxID=29655 RepID=A0A0K9PSS4_ZOSMR|nr:U-box domain-containing protein [Zostera marina]